MKKDYYSFLLRLKQVQTDDQQTWVVAVRNISTGQQQIFSNLEGLIQFLQGEFGNNPEATAPSATSDTPHFPIQ